MGSHQPIINGSIHAQEICIEQYLYWQYLEWTHHEMVVAVEGPYVTGMTEDDVVEELITAWQGLNRISVRQSG